MSPKSFLLTQPLHDYLLAHSTPLDEIQERLIARTAVLGDVAGMQIAPEQGIFMTLLCQVMNVRSAIEIGTFTGYSALSIARGMPPDGRLLCCDVNQEWTAIARAAWAEAGVDSKIELHLAPALETLRALPRTEQFDFAFVDADKANYRFYAEEIIPRLRVGGAVLFDNVLWGGAVIARASDGDEPNLGAIREFNDWLSRQPQLATVMLPIADGLTLAVRRA